MTQLVFFSHPPRPELAPFAEAIWGVRGVGSYHVESVLPNGAMELMVNFGPRQQVVGYGERAADDPFANAWLAGIQDQRLVHAAKSGADHISVRFRPGGAHAFFDLPMDELTDQVVELEYLIGAAARSLRDRLGEIPDDVGRCRAFEEWLLERRRAVHPYFATVRKAGDLLRSSRFRMSVAELCENLGLSNRYLGAQFRSVIGLSPKPFARVERFQSVIRSCRGRSRVEWARLAHEFRYADQAHLIREFRRLGSVTPGEFLARRSPDEGNVIVA
jgi:AraC-like DNA-binding protein